MNTKKIFSVSICCLFLVVFSPVKADWVQVNNGLTQLNVNALTSYTSGGVNYIFAGTLWGAQSGIFLTTNDGNSWNLMFSPNTDVWALTTAQSGGVNYIYAGCANNFFRSTNNGANWDNLILPNGSHWYYAVTASENYVFAGCKWWSNDPGGVYKSTNYGANWSLTSFPTSSFNDVYGLAINGSNVYAGSWSGTYVSTNLGDNWVFSPSGTSARAFAVNDNYVFAGGGGGVFVSTNNGMNWTQTSLNNATIYALVVYGNAIFSAGGFWVSTDNGMTWVSKTEGMPYFVRALTISNGYIFAGTDGHGVFRRYLTELVGIEYISNEIPESFKLFQNFPNPFNSTTSIPLQIPKPSKVELTVFDILGRQISQPVNEELKAGSYEVDWNGNNFSSGIYIYRLVVNNEIIDSKKLILSK